MSDPAEDFHDTRSRSSNVIAFPLHDTTSSSDAKLEALMLDVLADPQVENRLKGIVESAILDAWVKTRLFSDEPRDDPFDAIYVSELKSDKIKASDISRILLYRNISDLSGKIKFDDGWDE